MNYKHLSIFFIVAFILLTPIAFAQPKPGTYFNDLDQKGKNERGAGAIALYGNEQDIEKKCKTIWPENLAKCQDLMMQLFCGYFEWGQPRIGLQGTGWKKDDYLVCYGYAERARAGGIVNIAEPIIRIIQVGMTVAPAPSAGKIGDIIQQLKTAEEMIELGEEMEKEQKEKRKFDKTSAIDKLNDLVGTKVPEELILLGIENENINIYLTRNNFEIAAIGIYLFDGKFTNVGEAFSAYTMTVRVPEHKANALLNARSGEEVINLLSAGLADRSIKVEVTRGGMGNIAFRISEALGRIYSKYREYPFDVKTGQTKTVDLGGSGAKLKQNDLGQKIVSTEDSKVVYVVGRGGEVLGQSNRGAQNLINADPPRAGGDWKPDTSSGKPKPVGGGGGSSGSGLSSTAGYYGASSYGYVTGCYGGSTPYRYYDMVDGLMIYCEAYASIGTPCTRKLCP